MINDLIANKIFKILILNCRGRELNRENSTRYIVPDRRTSKEGGCVTLTGCDTRKCQKIYIKIYILLKSPTARRYCARLTGIDNEENICTLLSIFK